MPARPTLAQTVRLALQTATSTESPIRTALNIWYAQFVPADTPSATDLVTLANAVQSHWGTGFKGFLNTTSSFVECTATLIDGSETQGVSTNANVVGTASGGDLPESIAAVVSWKIAAAYRGGHPRTYIAGLDRGNLASGPSTNQLSSTAAAAIAAAGDAFLIAMNGVTIGTSIVTIGTVSYFRAKALRAVPVFYPYLGGSRVNTRLGTQRRRLGKLSVGLYET